MFNRYFKFVYFQHAYRQTEELFHGHHRKSSSKREELSYRFNCPTICKNKHCLENFLCSFIESSSVFHLFSLKEHSTVQQTKKAVDWCNF